MLTKHNEQIRHPIDRRFSVAPMLDWTDRHCRYFHRLMCPSALLYTEMITTGALIFGKADYLEFHAQEHPVALQLGGSHPSEMAHCAVLAQERGYDEVNINVGCPSDRVKNGSFGACLMATPDVVAQCVKTMRAHVDIPVTVKCRIGIDEMDEEEDLTRFVDVVASAGCDTFIVHARKAWLQGLSPKENREIPPLNYPRVYRLKQSHPELKIVLNGGVKDVSSLPQHWMQLDGVMMGREAYANPYCLTAVEAQLDNAQWQAPTREQVVEQMQMYIDAQQCTPHFKPWHVARHMLGLFQGQPGGRLWRRYISENGTGKSPDPQLLTNALSQVMAAQHDRSSL